MDVARVRFGFEGYAAEVSSGDPHMLDWVRRYLADFFPPPADSAETWRLHVWARREECDDAASRFERFAASYAVRDRQDAGASWGSTGNGLWWNRCLDPDTGGPAMYFVVDVPSQSITAWVMPDHPESCYAVARIVRSLLNALAQRQNWWPAHAALFSIDGRGYLVTGPKGSGKTSFLLYALRDLDAAFGSNDRVLLRDSGTGLDAHGVPTSVAVRNDSREQVALPRASRYYHQNPMVARTRFLVSEVCECFGCRVVPRCAVHRVIFLRCEDGPLRVVPADSIATRLLALRHRTICKFQPVWDELWPEPCPALAHMPSALDVSYARNRMLDALDAILREA